MTFEWYMARRYFRGQRSESRFLSFIKIMAITGVAVGAAGLLIALSITHGFKSVINGKIYDFAPHITVTNMSGDPVFRSDTVVTYISQMESVQSVQPTVFGQVMLQSRRNVSGGALKGVVSDGTLPGLSNYITDGEFNLEPDEEGKPGLLLGRGIAEAIGADIGSTVTVYSVDGIPSPLNPPDLKQFHLSGIYTTSIERFDNDLAIVSIEHARDLYDLGFLQASAVEITVDNPELINATYSDLFSRLPFPYDVQSIHQTYSNIFAWVDLQEQTIPLVISAMILIAAFNLIGTVLMMVLERVSDIGILKTLGSGNRSIRKIFLYEGCYVAGIGLLIGVCIAVLFNWLQATYQIIPLSAENYYMTHVPVEPQSLDFLIVSVLTLIFCLLASWVPARFAANTDPVNVLTFSK